MADSVRDGLRALPPGWLPAVKAYAERRSKAEAACSEAPLAGIVSDEAHLARCGARFRRVREREDLRSARTVRVDTEARPVRQAADGAAAGVLLELRIRRTVEQGGRTYTEERREWERVWPAEPFEEAGRGGSPAVVRVEPLIPERRPRFSSAAAPSGAGSGASAYWSQVAQKTASLPYLNRELLLRTPNAHARATLYRRDLAAAYADRWWNEANPAYEEFDVNCTNYVSQCIFAGRAPMNYTGRRDSGWWYRGREGAREWWSYSWSVANALARYLANPKHAGLRAREVSSASELKLGDAIAYDWFGDGHIHHSTIVTAFDRDGMPLVNANTVPSRHRYWDYKDSYAWTERTRCRFFHIADAFD